MAGGKGIMGRSENTATIPLIDQITPPKQNLFDFMAVRLDALEIKIDALQWQFNRMQNLLQEMHQKNEPSP